MVTVGYDEIEAFVARHGGMSWNGWNVEVLVKDYAGWMKSSGVQRNGTWYSRTVVEPNSDGKWVFEDRHVH